MSDNGGAGASTRTMHETVEHEFTVEGNAPWEGWMVKVDLTAYFDHTPGVASLTGIRVRDAELCHEDEEG